MPGNNILKQSSITLANFTSHIHNVLYLFQITSSDKMSTMVCEECIEKVSSWNSYKEQCVQNQKKFEDVLEPQQKPATPPPSFAPEPISESAPFAHLVS